MQDGKYVILCVDDDQDVLVALETVLDAEGYAFAGASSAEEGLRAYKETGFLVNGGITAALLAREVKQARPFLVPFLRWCTARDVVPTTESAGGFLESYDCTQPLSRLFQNMQS